MRRAIIIAVVVGAVLNVINHGDVIICNEVSVGCLLKIGLTFLVPYAVSTISGVGAMLENENNIATPAHTFEASISKETNP